MSTLIAVFIRNTADPRVSCRVAEDGAANSLANVRVRYGTVLVLYSTLV